MRIERAAHLAVQNLIKEGLTDIFSTPFEVNLLRNKEFARKIELELVRGLQSGSLEGLRVHPIEHVLLPKNTAFDFRRCALMQPLDTAKYLALSLLFAEVIERRRPPKGKRIVFSYRFAPKNGYLFDSQYSHTRFRENVSNECCRSRTRILVSCDIAGFYDRLNLHRLESLLLSLEVDTKTVALLNQLLLFWANRDSYGLPVGSNASRILAEAALLEVDSYLLSMNVRFSRFVDDYRLFAPDAKTAHYWLTQLIERLWLEGLTINKAKTMIEDVSNRKVKTPAGKGSKNDEKVSANEAPVDNEDKKALEVKEDPTTPQFRIIAGYGGVIPTRFRESSLAEKERLSKFDLEELLSKIKNANVVDPMDIRTFARAALYSGKPKYLRVLPSVLDKFPQFTPFVVDLLIKHIDIIPEDIKSEISDFFAEWLIPGKYLPEFVAIEVVRILGKPDYEKKDALFAFFRSLRRNAGAYIGRALLDALECSVTRGEVLEIRQYFQRADQWEKRQIVRIVERSLHDDEKRAWMKNIAVHQAGDLFLLEMVRPSKKLRKGTKASRKQGSN